MHARSHWAWRGLTLAAVALGLPTRPASAELQDLKYTIIVSEFENRSNLQGWFELSTAWTTILTDQLNQTGQFIVIGEADMRAAATREQAFAASGQTVQGRRTPPRSQMTPAQLLLKGVITDFQQSSSTSRGVAIPGVGAVGNSQEITELRATLYLIDSATGMVVASNDVRGRVTRTAGQVAMGHNGYTMGRTTEQKGNVKDAMTAAIREGIDWMATQAGTIPWRATVVMVEGDDVYVDKGAREGVSEGMAFSVGESKIIRSPDTGEVLDEIVTELAQLKVVRVRDKISICQVTQGDKTTIYEGMGVSPLSL